jgi:RNA polymerase sigma-70 factor (ECF subfamily)
MMAIAHLDLHSALPSLVPSTMLATMNGEDDDHTEALTASAAGDCEAASRLLPQVYDELRAIAATYMQRERAEHTLQPTALVHEAYMRLIDIERIDWQGRNHFLAMAATQMRRILVNHARDRGAQKRGGGQTLVTLNEDAAVADVDTVEMLALDEALQKLGAASPRQGRVAEMRLFAGLKVDEIANVLEVSARTVKMDWRVARAWLRRELGRPAESER